MFYTWNVTCCHKFARNYIIQQENLQSEAQQAYLPRNWNIVTLVRLHGWLIYIVILTDLFFLWDFDLLLCLLVPEHCLMVAWIWQFRHLLEASKRSQKRVVGSVEYTKGDVSASRSILYLLMTEHCVGEYVLYVLISGGYDCILRWV